MKHAKKTIDSLFNGLEQDKASAKKLLKQKNITEKNLKQIAKTIYLSTLRSILQTDRKLELAERIVRDIQSYRMPVKDDDLKPFIDPAFDFAIENGLIETYRSERGTYPWRTKENIDILFSVSQYKKDFKEKDMVTYLRMLLSSS